MSKDTPHKGDVIEEHAGNIYLVKLHDGREVLCYLAGKMKFNRIHVLIGDRVDVLLDPYKGNATNRIVRRY